MAEERLLQGPKKLLVNALKAVKGENTMQLVEQFTAEMTTVAEGLCEDQSRLQSETENLGREMDRRTQHLETALKDCEETLKETRQEMEQKLDKLDTRLAAMEKRLSGMEEKQKSSSMNKQGLLSRMTVLAAIVCGSWVLVTILNLLKP